MADGPLATAELAWLAAAFDPVRPSALRRWVRAHVAQAVPDGELVDALVLVVNEAVTTSGAAAAGPVPVELWRTPSEVRCVVACAGPLSPVARAVVPADPLVRDLWMVMQVSRAITVAVTAWGAGSRITVTLPANGV